MMLSVRHIAEINVYRRKKIARQEKRKRTAVRRIRKRSRSDKEWHHPRGIGRRTRRLVIFQRPRGTHTVSSRRERKFRAWSRWNCRHFLKSRQFLTRGMALAIKGGWNTEYLCSRFRGEVIHARLLAQRRQRKWRRARQRREQGGRKRKEEKGRERKEEKRRGGRRQQARDKRLTKERWRTARAATTMNKTTTTTMVCIMQRGRQARASICPAAFVAADAASNTFAIRWQIGCTSMHTNSMYDKDFQLKRIPTEPSFRLSQRIVRQLRLPACLQAPPCLLNSVLFFEIIAVITESQTLWISSSINRGFVFLSTSRTSTLKRTVDSLNVYCTRDTYWFFISCKYLYVKMYVIIMADNILWFKQRSMNSLLKIYKVIWNFTWRYFLFITKCSYHTILTKDYRKHWNSNTTISDKYIYRHN